MPKPFTNLQIIYGVVVITKDLLLEEQAIGDVMQFITLLPSLFNEAGHIGLLLNNRLLTIYRRSSQNIFIPDNYRSFHSKIFKITSKTSRL